MEATCEKYAKDGVIEKASSLPSSPIAASSIQNIVDGATTTTISKSKKKRAQEARKLASRIKALIDEGRVEEDVKGVQVVKITRASTKQAMVARVSTSITRGSIVRTKDTAPCHHFTLSSSSCPRL